MSFVEKFADEGWLPIGGLFAFELIDRLRAEVEGQLEQLLGREGDHRGCLRVGNERLMLSVKLQGPFLNPHVYANPLLLTVVQQLLDPDIVIDSFTCVLAMPGAAEQHLHRDHAGLFPTQTELESNLPPYAVTVVIPLVDLRPETGTTRLFPGTHRGEEPQGFELPYADRGNCFLFDYRLLHQGTANQSAAARPVLYITYARPWFIDVGNFRRQPRIRIDSDDLREIRPEHWPLFRRLAGKGSIDLSEEELFPEGMPRDG